MQSNSIMTSIKEPCHEMEQFIEYSKCRNTPYPLRGEDERFWPAPGARIQLRERPGSYILLSSYLDCPNRPIGYASLLAQEEPASRSSDIYAYLGGTSGIWFSVKPESLLQIEQIKQPKFWYGERVRLNIGSMPFLDIGDAMHEDYFVRSIQFNTYTQRYSYQLMSMPQDRNFRYLLHQASEDFLLSLGVTLPVTHTNVGLPAF